jgi:amidophosphoribosyltransferase
MFTEACGVFAISSKDINILDDLYLGTFYLQHRGQEYCGLSTYDGKDIKIRTHKGLVRESFANDLPGLEGTHGIGHASLKDRQPIKFYSKMGEFTICFSGNIINRQALIDRFKSEGHSFYTNEDIEVIAKLIAHGSNFVEGIEYMAKEIRGSYSVALLCKDGIFVARDKFGYKPLIIGKRNGVIAVSSESCAFNNLGISIVKDVGPGEIIHIKDGTMNTEKIIKADMTQFCAFEWIYFAEISSIIDGMPVATARKNMGACLARRYSVPADVVAPVPNSGIGHALGYSIESKIPYDYVFVKYGYASRSYTKPTQEERDREAKVKLIPIAANIKNKRVVLCDDSIVRGTQMKNDLVVKLRNAGVKEIHVRIACPPLKSPCKYGKSTRTKKELAAAERSVEEVRKYIGVDTLGYNTIEDLQKSIGMTGKQMCLSCWMEGD